MYVVHPVKNTCTKEVKCGYFIKSNRSDGLRMFISLWAVGAMISLGSMSLVTDVQIPVLNRDVPHSWDHSGAHA